MTLLLVADKKRGKGIESFFGTDAGCMAMAVQLATEALGMGSVIRASFDAAKMTAALGEDGAARICRRFCGRQTASLVRTDAARRLPP